MITVKTESNSRVLYIDILRIVSIFAVILLHVSAPYVENMHAYGVNAWWVGNMVDSATRWCVPVLIMVSGKLMLNNDKDIRIIYFLKKRFIKILVPLIFWSFIYMIWNNRFVLEWNLDLFLNFIKKLYEGNVYIHLWYLYMIIGLYLITPIIKVYIDKTKRSSIIYFLVIWFIANGIIGFWEKFIDLKTNFNLDFFHWSIGFYILGAFLDKEKLSKKVVFFFHSLGIIGLLITIIGTYIYYK